MPAGAGAGMGIDVIVDNEENKSEASSLASDFFI